MPLYSFRCKSCNHEFETLVRGGETPVCASCGGGELDKMVSRPAPDGKSAGILKTARAAAAGQGHFSNYSRSERSKL